MVIVFDHAKLYVWNQCVVWPNVFKHGHKEGAFASHPPPPRGWHHYLVAMPFRSLNSPLYTFLMNSCFID